MKSIISFFTAFIVTTTLSSQVIYFEDFESRTLPEGWSVESNASDGGWRFVSTLDLTSQNFPVAPNGSEGVAGSNDDACNCDKRNEYLITEGIDLTDYSSVVLRFDAFFTDNNYLGAQEDVTIEISKDKINWEIIENLHGHASWDQHSIDISSYAGDGLVYIGFRYHDGNGWLYGVAIDNFIIEIPLQLDAALVDLESKTFGEVNKPFTMGGVINNKGADAVNSIELSYSINGVVESSQLFENVDLASNLFWNFSFDEDWVPSMEGDYTIEVEILSVNGSQDLDPTNNKMSFNTKVIGDVEVPNKISQILNSAAEVVPIANTTHGLDKPTDLDFFPLLGKDELWVINERVESSGGSTVTISNTTDDVNRSFDMRVDGNAWHFMSLPTALAFSDDNFNFASSTGVQDANHSGGTFTGPTLWSSDPTIYAQPSGGNGSHLDMLHGSPLCMGIAHEVDNVFWVYDAWNSDIVRYDFVADHGPGNDDHSDGKLHRYQNIGISKDNDIPNHMMLDKKTGWLYFVDNGNDRVMRLDINSGTSGQNLALINEPLSEHIRIDNFDVEMVAEGFDRPCGLEIFENYLLIGNYGSGLIDVFDMDQEFLNLGSIDSGDPGLTGIKVGPDGNIWCTNRLRNELNLIMEGDPTSISDLALNDKIEVYPNPVTETIFVTIPQISCLQEIDIEITDAKGQKVYFDAQYLNCQSIDVTFLANGSYFLSVNLEGKKITEKLIVDN
ncbi:MAG: T9SS type A sorting domain-containing protein [Saprospiraceae bacterium]|nr:T9SS type A sorting domain-containing protein [Bacteroidia bacterium]NNE14360.1 T9SS type A sorting domain-containing protein [Saprospiraceae bacterium]NNL92099.1 T9SS type A sorting domain-containing protein [Saprospiraceae bacterium]